MKLTVSQVASLLGRSERQVRYQLKNGELRAERSVREWLFDSEALPLSEGQRRALGARVETARDAFEKGIATPAEAAGPAAKRSFSVRDAFWSQAERR